MKEDDFKYGKPANPIAAKPKVRLPQYDEALREFLKSGYDNWEVNLDSLPSNNPRVVLSSLKWRVRHKEEFKTINAFMHKNRVYLERIKE